MSEGNTCGCCETTPPLNEISNRPGLSALEYRIGVYGSFLKRLLDQIHAVQLPSGPSEGAQPLTALTTRSSDDFSIALLDAWAVVADILTFYQERIANEGYLRTATERRSILELARAIGYELAPGVASNIFLQFTVENIIGTPVPGTPSPANSAFNSGKVAIPKGTQVQSIPGPNQLPQMFETSADFEAQVSRNQLLPRLERTPDLALCNGKLYLLGTSTSFKPGTFTQLPVTQVYVLNSSTSLDPSLSHVPAVEMNQIYLQGTNTNVKQGDRFLLVGVRNSVTKTQSFVVRDVETDSTMNHTLVNFGTGVSIPTFEPFEFPPAVVTSKKLAFTKNNVKTQILETNISESNLDALLQDSGWGAKELTALVNQLSPPPDGRYGAFAFRAAAGFFGHNAPAWKSLPNPSTAQREDPYPSNWDSPNKGRGRLIWTDSQNNSYPDADAFLERTFPQILANSWVLFESPTAGAATYQVSATVEKSLADYGFSGRATGLKLELQAQVKGIGLSTPSIVSANPNQVDAFAVGVDGHLYHRWTDSGGHWQPQVPLDGSDYVGSPSAVSWGPNRIDVFAIGSDGNLFHWWTDGNNQWAGPENRGGGNLVNSPSAVSRASDSLDIVAIGSDGNLHHFYWENQQWHGPNNWGGGNMANSPSAVPLGPDALVVYAVSKDGNLYETVWIKIGNQEVRTGPLIPPGMDAGIFVESPSAVFLPIVGSFYVALRLAGGPISLYSLETVLGQYFGIWQPLIIVSGEFTGSPVALVSSFASIEVFGIGSDGDVQAFSWAFNEAPFQIVFPKSLGGDGDLSKSPTAVVLQPGKIGVAAVGGSGHWFYTSGDGTTWQPLQDLGNGTMVPFPVRSTTAYVQSEQLSLAPVPVVDNIPAGLEKIMLDNMVLGLAAGQPVSFSGVRADAPAVAASEIVIIHDVVHSGGFTTFTFLPKLQHSYVRSSVTMSANVTTATNGATVNEVLGNGDGSKANQSFTLKRPPLTFTSASTPSGTAGTLEVRVNDLPWHQVQTLYQLNPRDEAYIVRLGDDGTPTITFGEPAARLKSGQQNVRATYRTGIGGAGNVDAGSVSILMSRPPGLRGVTNPLPATGGANAQKLSEARENAPLTVLTLERIVSLADYENFAKAFAGVGKAQAIAVWSGETRLAHLTVAASNGDSVATGGALYKTLVGAITRFHDPVQTFLVAGYQALAFDLTLAVLVDEPAFDRDTVHAKVASTLSTAFSFEKRSFAQAVTEAEIVALIQAVPGVVASNVSQLYLAGDPNGPSQTEPPPFLPALPARWDGGAIQPAQLLLLHSSGVTLTEMAR